MDTLTHALSGALAARLLPATPSRSRSELRQLSWLGFLAAAAPDLDFVISLFASEPMTYLNHHRGVTHSIILLPLWAALLTGIFRPCFRALNIRLIYGICCLSLGLHILGDVITSYGTMIFAPFSNYRAALDTTFIIDPIFSGIILCALLASWWRPQRLLLPRVVGGLLLAYIGLQAWAHQQAVALGAVYARQQQLEAEIQALPQPLSPFHWKLVVIDPNRYHMSYLKLMGDPVTARPEDGFFKQIASIYRPATELHWENYDRPDSVRASDPRVNRAWRNPALDDYRAFARYPVQTLLTHAPHSCTWFSDLQFQLPGRPNPFTFGLCNEPGNNDVFLTRWR